MSKRRIAIVDAYSSGALFPAYFAKRDVECVHIQSTSIIPDVYAGSFVPLDFVSNIIHSGNVDQTINSLRKWNPEQVIAGIESGVELADQLSEAMGTLTNGTALSLARRDKFEMVKALGAAGVRHAKSFTSPILDELLRWIKKNTAYPVVVKPPKSAGTDHVAICQSPLDVSAAFHQIIGQKNRLGAINETVMVQEFLDGPEYIIDSVTFNGVNVVCDYQASIKAVHEGARVYDVCTCLPFDGEVAKILAPYVSEVLDALGIKYGPSHMEVILTQTGPVLVEVGARLGGCKSPAQLRQAVLTDQCELTVDCYLDPETAGDKWKNHPMKLHNAMSRVFLISDAEGTFQGLAYEDRIRSLKSFARLTPVIQPGQPLVKTANLFTTPAYIDFCHPDPEQVRKDFAQLRQWEKAPDFYVLGDSQKRASIPTG